MSLTLTGAPTFGQILPQDIKAATGELTEEQRASLAEFVDPLMEGLVAGNPADISTARTIILREFNSPAATPEFKEAFSNQIGKHMSQAMGAEDELVRINAMIITTRLTTDLAQELIDQGLSDSNAAVQYWGAKAYRDRVLRMVDEQGRSRLPNDEQQKIIQRVKELIETDPVVAVVQSSFEILIALSVPEAQRELLDQLNNRVTKHAQQPQMSYRAEQEALRQLTNKFIRERRVEKRDQQALMSASFRYFMLTTRQMNRGVVLPENQAGHKAMMDTSHQALAAIGAREQGVELPEGFAEVKDLIRLNSWEKLTQVGQRWQPVLQAPPFELIAQQLLIPPPPASE
ncbi:MAG: hypothetical protein AAGC44_02165 [Planctomycetota bacterium]